MIEKLAPKGLIYRNKIISSCLIFVFALFLLPPSSANAEYLNAAKPLVATSSSAPQQNIPLSAIPKSSKTTAVYGSPIRNASGEIDATATVKALKARNIKIVNYLIYNNAVYNSAKDAQALPALLHEARNNGMGVWVTLVPPSEASTYINGKPTCTGNNYPPYYGRYDSWMAWLVSLKTKHPNLQAVIMDDLGRSMKGDKATICHSFDPSDVVRWKKTLNKAKIKFAGVLYSHDFLPGRVYSQIRPYIDFIVWPFTDLTGKTLTTQYTAVKKVAGKTPVTVMVFAKAYRTNMVSATGVATTIKNIDKISSVPSITLYQPKL